MAVKQFAYSEDQNNLNQKNTQFVYPLFLIFLIPVLIILNTFWELQQFQKINATELQNKTILAKTIFASTIADSLNEEDVLQEKIEKITKSDNELQEITILKPIADGFQVLASSNTASLGAAYKSLQYSSAWAEDKDITILTPKEKGQEQNWIIISPLENSNSEKVALLSLKISTADANALTEKTITNSLVALAVTIFFVLLLLFNYSHFFEYAVLFKKLKEVDAMKDDFISMVSHELKTPMAAIKGYMAMIFEGVAGKVDQKAKVHLEKVLANIKRLDALVDALLDVSRLEQGRMQFDMQSVDICEVLTAVTSEIDVQAKEKKLKLEYQPLPTPCPFIFADPERLDQVFENIIGNAIKYTFKGSISVYHRIEEDQLKTIIQDTGIGMSKQDMKDLFKRFYRIRNEKTADIPGTGLGLWITKEIVLKMNGQIYAESKEGIGSIFTIVFPIVKENKK
ncbi:MAG: HAMP domain-containing histidine kinase [Patescibacteria group bacterium]|nr:HAMP domain-containing histidine kinase [Patescibacteria group bacterium]